MILIWTSAFLPAAVYCLMFVMSTLWFRGSESERGEYRLLCTDGLSAPLSDFRRCNLGRGPGGGVVTRNNYRKIARKFLTAITVCVCVCVLQPGCAVWL